jgi:hypothetical protein
VRGRFSAPRDRFPYSAHKFFRVNHPQSLWNPLPAYAESSQIVFFRGVSALLTAWRVGTSFQSDWTGRSDQEKSHLSFRPRNQYHAARSAPVWWCGSSRRRD